MRKKIIIIVIITVAILAITIPIVVSRLDRNKITISSDLVNGNKTEEEIQAEKKRIMEKYKTNEVKTVSEDERLEDERIAKESEKEVAKRDAKIINAVRKIYPEEADKIIAELKGENTRSMDVNEKSPEIEWYKLTAKVLEENKVTGEEKELLKNFLDDSRLTVKQENDEELLKRIDKILEK